MILSGDDIPQAKRTHRRTGSSKIAAVAHLRRLRKRTREAMAAARSVVLIMGLPGAGKSTHAATVDGPGVLVIDSCAATPAHREPLIAAAKRAKVPIDCVLICAPLELCRIRRPYIPAAEFAKIRARLVPPRRAEGFRSVCYIQGTHNGTQNDTTPESDRPERDPGANCERG